MNDRVSEWILGNRFHGGVYRRYELIAKTRVLRFVPVVGVFDVSGRSRPEDR